MAKIKNEILSELYSIKAGLSLISLEKEKLENEESKVKRSNYDVNKNNDDINSAKHNISNLNANIVAINEEFNKLTTQKKKKIKKEKVTFGDFLIAVIGGVVIQGAAQLLMVLYGVFALLISEWYRDAAIENFNHSVRILGIILAIGIPVAYLIYRFASSHSNNKHSKEAIETSYNNQKSELRESVQTAESLLKQNEEWLVELESQTESIKEEHNQNVVVYDQVVTVSKETAKIIYNSLVKEYNDTLNSREWGHLDLIIYYFETGRADSIKEALQLLDKQLQHEELIETLKIATTSICEGIESSINSLKYGMVECFGKLAAQMAIYQQETMNRLSQIEDNIDNNANLVNETVKRLSYNMSEIASQERMNSALLSKINVGSKELVNDTNYLLSYAKSNWN